MIDKNDADFEGKVKQVREYSQVCLFKTSRIQTYFLAVACVCFLAY